MNTIIQIRHKGLIDIDRSVQFHVSNTSFYRINKLAQDIRQVKWGDA